MEDQSTVLNLTNAQQGVIVVGLIFILAIAYLGILMIMRTPADIRKMTEDDDNV